MAGVLESMNTQGPVAVSPAAAMVPAASGGNTAIADLMQNMIAGSQQRQNYLEQQQEAYNRDLQRYASFVEKSQQPENNEAAMWGSMAKAAAGTPGGWINTGTMLANIGGAYGDHQALRQHMDIRNQADLTKTRQAEVRALEASKQNSDLMRTLYGKSVTPEQLRTVYTGARNEAAQIAKDHKFESAEARAQWIEDYAKRAVNTYQQNFSVQTGAAYGVRGTPATDVTANSAELPDLSAQPIGMGERKGAKDTVDVAGPLSDLLSKEDAATAERLINNINKNPSAAQRDTAILERLLMKYDKPTQSTSQAGVVSSVKPEPIDKVKREKDIAEAKAMGKAEGERAGAEPDEVNRIASATRGLDEWRAIAVEALEHPGLEKTVGAEGYIPGRGRVLTAASTDAANFKALMNPLLAKSAFAELQAMRDASKTGGALGAITERELDRLENSIAAMSLEQSPAQFKAQLKKVVAHIDSIKEGMSKAHTVKYGDKPSPSPNPAPHDDSAEAKEARYQAWKKAQVQK